MPGYCQQSPRRESPARGTKGTRPRRSDGARASPISGGTTISGGRLTIRRYVCYTNGLMRRKPDALLPIESIICFAAADLRRRGIREFHGYELAKHLGKLERKRFLTAYGTLYRALGRLERMGYLSSRWEDADAAVREARPLRRLYVLTAHGSAAVREAEKLGVTLVPFRVRTSLVPA